MCSSLRLLSLLLGILAETAFAFVTNPPRTNPSIGKSEYQSSFLCLASAVPSTAQQDPEVSSYQLGIEYCTGCRWGLRGFWLAQEVLTTFQDETKLSAVTLIPSRPSMNEGARFRVHLWSDAVSIDIDDSYMLWDRKEKGGFPEAKDIKQLVRDVLNPELYLGHSDTADKQDKKANISSDGMPVVLDFSSDVMVGADRTLPANKILNGPLPNIAITYCTGCRWLLRAAYFAQELMTTFSEEINSLTFIPSRRPAKGGAFVVTVTTTINSEVTTVWDRNVEGRFPETKELKQSIRDLVNPDRDLGHSDVEGNRKATITTMDDDDAEQARRMFGVA